MHGPVHPCHPHIFRKSRDNIAPSFPFPLTKGAKKFTWIDNQSFTLALLGRSSLKAIARIQIYQTTEM